MKRMRIVEGDEVSGEEMGGRRGMDVEEDTDV